MPLTCPRCSRLNPDQALYCHSDGLALRAYQAPTAANHLPRTFVFAARRTCTTFTDLVTTCQDNWPEARTYIKQGTFASYFGAHGRKDLMQAAQEAGKNPDPDRGLDEFLSCLPAEGIPGPRLVA